MGDGDGRKLSFMVGVNFCGINTPTQAGLSQTNDVVNHQSQIQTEYVTQAS